MPSHYPRPPFTPAHYPLSAAELNSRRDFVWEAKEENWLLRSRVGAARCGVDEGMGTREQWKDEKKGNEQRTIDTGSANYTVADGETETREHCDGKKEITCQSFRREDNRQTGKAREQKENTDDIQPDNKGQENKSHLDNKETILHEDNEIQPENVNQMESHVKSEGKLYRTHLTEPHLSIPVMSEEGDETKESSQSHVEDSGEVTCEGLKCLKRRGEGQVTGQGRVEKPVKVAAKWHSPPKNIFNPTAEVSCSVSSVSKMLVILDCKQAFNCSKL